MRISPFLRVVHTRDEIDERALAASRRADDADGRAGRYDERTLRSTPARRVAAGRRESESRRCETRSTARQPRAEDARRARCVTMPRLLVEYRRADVPSTRHRAERD